MRFKICLQSTSPLVSSVTRAFLACFLALGGALPWRFREAACGACEVCEVCVACVACAGACKVCELAVLKLALIWVLEAPTNALACVGCSFGLFFEPLGLPRGFFWFARAAANWASNSWIRAACAAGSCEVEVLEAPTKALAYIGYSFGLFFEPLGLPWGFF